MSIAEKKSLQDFGRTTAVTTGTTHIFDRLPRSNPLPARHAEGTFAFLNRVDDPVFERVRELIEEWFGVYPCGALQDQSARDELRGRFRSGTDNDFTSAFWELYLHEVHRRLGYRVTPHPETPTGARVDFAIEGHVRFYLEATVSTGAALGSPPAPGLGAILDKVNEAFDPNFFVKVEGVVAGDTTPSRADIVNGLEDWLRKLDWDDVWSRCVANNDELPRTTLPARDWQITFRAHPKSPKVRGDRSFPTIGVYPTLSGFSRARDSILGKLRAKASRYGKLDAPFVIAIQSLAVAGGEEDVEQALFGPETFVIPVGPGAPAGQAVPGRQPQGLWQWGNERRATRVSGVLGAVDFSPYGITRAWPRLWTNPWATCPLDVGALPWPKTVPNLDTNSFEHTPAAIDPHNFFGLPQDWPGKPFEKL